LSRKKGGLLPRLFFRSGIGGKTKFFGRTSFPVPRPKVGERRGDRERAEKKSIMKKVVYPPFSLWIKKKSFFVIKIIVYVLLLHSQNV
jgi:hypothetical protein